MSAPETKVIIIREGVLRSWAKDGVTFGLFMFMLWFNTAYGGGSGWAYFAIAVGFVAMAINHHTKMSPDEARKWLDDNFPGEGA